MWNVEPKMQNPRQKAVDSSERALLHKETVNFKGVVVLGKLLQPVKACGCLVSVDDINKG